MRLPLSKLKASDIPHTLQQILADELEQLSKHSRSGYRLLTAELRVVS
jgi:hypothetical protein